MEYLSTSSIAKELDLSSSELFAKLRGLGLIVREGDKWLLTDAGRSKGGQTRNNTKYGEFIVWPKDIDFEASIGRGDSLNTTAIGKHFGVTAHRMNPILAELGWVEKEVSGWRVTKLGTAMGGRQMEHESGSSFVVWPAAVLHNKRLLDVVHPPDQAALQQEESGSLGGPGFREKFPASHRTIDGHMVRSRAELLIDNWLYQYGIVHAYERRLNIEEECYCDFYIPHGPGRPQAVYIEFWGMEGDSKYAERKRKKLELYRKNEIPLIELNDGDIVNLDDVLARKLLQFKIKVG